VDIVKEAEKVRPGLKASVLITRKGARTAIGKGAREALKDCGLPVLATELGYRIAYQEAPAAGLGVAQYAPRDAAALEVRALVDELVSTKKGRRRAA
jgi:chromosome partitioning protein